MCRMMQGTGGGRHPCPTGMRGGRCKANLEKAEMGRVEDEKSYAAGGDAAVSHHKAEQQRGGQPSS